MEDNIINCSDVSNVNGNDFCMFKTVDMTKLEEHVELEHTDHKKPGRTIQKNTKEDAILVLKGPLSCSRCQNFLNKPQWKMRKHIETHTKEGWAQCNLCEKTFPDSWHLKVHKRNHTGEKPHICSYCDKSYPDLSKLKRHLVTHEETPSEYKLKHHKCPLCGIRFDQTYKLQIHMNYHKGVTPYKCGECRKSFTEKRVLKRHQSSHKAKDHSCSMCVRKFVDPLQLQTHMTRHKTIKCNVCPFKTTKKADLKKHVKTHEIDFKPQPCPKCGKNFSVKVLEKHMKTHGRKCISTSRVIELLKGSAPCKRCKNYISKPFWKMKKHITTSHTKEGRFKCTYCDKRFIDSWHLREHERSHTGERPFHCPVCQIQFSASGSMNQHVKKMHQITPKENGNAFKDEGKDKILEELNSDTKVATFFDEMK